MSDDTAKFEAFAPPALRWMPKWVRENLSPRAAWLVILAAFTAGGWITHESGQRVALEHANGDLQKSQTKLVEATDKLRDAVNDLKSDVKSLTIEVKNTNRRVDEQQQKWDKVEDTAETFHVPKQRRGPSRSK